MSAYMPPPKTLAQAHAYVAALPLEFEARLYVLRLGDLLRRHVWYLFLEQVGHVLTSPKYRGRVCPLTREECEEAWTHFVHMALLGVEQTEEVSP